MESASLSTSLEALNSSLAQSATELKPDMLAPFYAEILAHAGLQD